MGKTGCFYRRIKSAHLRDGKINVQAFMPNERERERKIGPSVVSAAIVGPEIAIIAHIGEECVNWCEARGGHLVEFHESILPAAFKIEPEGKKKSHYQIKGPIYEDGKATYGWAYQIAAKARVRLLCIDKIAKDVLPGKPPCAL